MEASALHAPARFARLTSSPSLLRLRSDEQLVSLLRAGNPDAFRAIHERYGQRLFAYVRQMLGPGSRQDAEDVLQDVFARTYTTLRTDDREINLRPWLYRVAHNRCIDHLRRPGPATTELVETSGKALHDPFEEVQRREDLQRLVSDISRLPDQQKSALLLREINGLSYRELAEALDVTVPAVKSLLVRARVELVETVQAREAACGTVREELALACDVRSARPSPRVRRHLRDCVGCQEYQTGMRGMRRSFAALSPVAVAGPLALGAKLVGLGGSSGGTSAGSGLAGSASSGGLAFGTSSGGLAAGTAGKIAAVVSTAAITAGGAVEIERRVGERTEPAPAADARPAPGRSGEVSPATRSAPTSASGPSSRDNSVPVATQPRESGASRRADKAGSGERPKSAGTREPVARPVAGDRGTGSTPVAGGAPVAGRGPEIAPGSGSAGSDDLAAGGGPAAGANPGGGGAPAVSPPAVPVTTPDRTPAAPPARPGAPEAAPPAPVKAPAVPARPVEVPVGPRVKAKPVGPPVSAKPVGPPLKAKPVEPPVNEKVTGQLKPDKVVGPKPGRGPKVDVGL